MADLRWFGHVDRLDYLSQIGHLRWFVHPDWLDYSIIGSFVVCAFRLVGLFVPVESCEVARHLDLLNCLSQIYLILFGLSIWTGWTN